MKPESLSGITCDSELQQLKQHLEESEKKLVTYKNLLEAMEKRDVSDAVLEHCPNLSKAVMENAKLKYRMEILQASIRKQEQLNEKNSIKDSSSEAPVEKKSKTNKSSESGDGKPTGNKKPSKETKHNYVIVKDFGSSLLYMLRALFSESVSKLYPELSSTPVLITETQQIKFGDYQFNSSMSIAKKLEQNGQKISPQEVAREIVENLPKCDRIEKMEVAGPGFINIFLSKNWIAASIANIALKGIEIPVIEKRRVVVDFSSPNIAKQMHVGHLRSTIIGDSISRLLTYVGFDVLRLNHIGDWGTQFGMLIAHLQDCFPNFINEVPPVSDLQAFYKESKKRFDEDEAFKARAYQCVTKLQSFDPDFVKAWQIICDVSRKDFNQIYDRLDINIVERGESFYQKYMIDLVEELEQLGVLELDEGRKILRFGEEVPLTVVKSDGGFTYDTSDLAALKYRLYVDKADWIIYVVDAGQSLHFELIYAAGQKLGWYSPTEKRVELVSFGLVLGEDKKKFKTRSGDTVRLTDLLDEGVKRAEIKLQEKERDKVMISEELALARDAVAYGCVKYADLSQTRTQDYVFSFDRMLDDRGNTAVYLLYAFARIKSICRNSEVSEEDIQNYVNSLPDGILPLEHKSEFRLAKTILKFTDCILNTLDNFLFHQLCDYVYSLATTFHDFYNECYVIHKDLDEICRQFGMLQLDLSDADALSTACIYLADPHKLPGPAKDDSDNATKANDSATVFHYERTNEQNGLSKQYQVNDMSISDCDSDFEETLRHHFQYVPRPKADKEVEKNDDSSIDFASSLKQKDVNGTISVLVALTESSRSHISPRKRNFSLQNATETVSTSNSKSPSSEGKKRRRTNYHFDETNSPVQQFCSTSIVASTPLSTKLDSERRTRLTLINSAVRTKVRQSKQRTLLNLSTNNTDPMNTVNSKDETTRREQGAIAKHIARIRTSSSRLNSSKEAFLSFNDTSRYYSMRTSFSSNGSASFS
uniref:Probable arginine--tRNA ligase, cytoplasmic n=1 Tax=Elaeophora elaphi TaxID=1147741 RepID=A0A0R3RHW4_9BILA